MAVIAAMFLLYGCIEKNKHVPFEEVNIDNAVRDTMLYGFCAHGSNYNVLQMVTDAGDTLSLRMSQARMDSLVIGGYEAGDELAVTVNGDTTEATMVINKSALHGQWVMPNPIDGSSDTGISIQRGGTAESIEQDDIVYKSWRLFNGKLVLSLTHEDGAGNDETQTFSISKLTRDSLIIADDDGIYEYGHPSFVPEDELDIELDDGMGDFFL